MDSPKQKESLIDTSHTVVSFINLEATLKSKSHKTGSIEKTKNPFLTQVILVLGLLTTIFMAAYNPNRESTGNGNSIDGLIEHLDERIPKYQRRYNVPGVSIALIHDGELVWSGAYGYADLEEKRKMEVGSICRAESISKSVSAWGVMHLVEEGLIDLDAPIETYLVDWQFPPSEFDTQEVTLRRLLSGNAGLPLGTIGEASEYAPNSHMPSLREALSDEARLIKEPGSGFLYSNPGFNVLELLIESVTGQDFASYMEMEILEPLGMSGASYSWDEAYAEALPTGYELQGDPVYPYVYPVKASGGLFSNVEDIARFVTAGIEGPYARSQDVLTEESIHLIHSPQVEIPGLFGVVADSYGFGHFIETLPDGQKAVWHGGQGHGWMTHFHLVPESGAGIVILTNSQRSWPLIAGILTDWASWNGFGPVKFSRIQQATVGMQILGVLIILAGLQQVYHLVKSVRDGKRRFELFKGSYGIVRILKFVLGVSGIAILAWGAFQPYLFITSIFPGTINLVAGGILGLLLVILVSGLFVNKDSLKHQAQS